MRRGDSRVAVLLLLALISSSRGVRARVFFLQTQKVQRTLTRASFANAETRARISLVNRREGTRRTMTKIVAAAELRGAHLHVFGQKDDRSPEQDEAARSAARSRARVRDGAVCELRHGATVILGRRRGAAPEDATRDDHFLVLFCWRC